jgi:hypothetical protein
LGGKVAVGLGGVIGATVGAGGSVTADSVSETNGLMVISVGWDAFDPFELQAEINTLSRIKTVPNLMRVRDVIFCS